MGGKRHTGIGFNRPKKRKVSPLVPAPATSEDTVETKEPSPPPSPEREPSPVAPARPAPKPRHLTIDKSGLALAREQMRDAEKEYQKVQRRWERKKLTYFDYDKYSPWAEVSVVQRIKARLQQADDDLDAARSDWVFRREVWLRLRTHLRMTKLKEENPGDKEIVSQWLTAGIRLTGIFGLPSCGDRTWKSSGRGTLPPAGLWPLRTSWLASWGSPVRGGSRIRTSWRKRQRQRRRSGSGSNAIKPGQKSKPRRTRANAFSVGWRRKRRIHRCVCKADAWGISAAASAALPCERWAFACAAPARAPMARVQNAAGRPAKPPGRHCCRSQRRVLTVHMS